MSNSQNSNFGFIVLVVLLVLFIAPLYFGINSLEVYLTVQKKMLLWISLVAVIVLGVLSVLVLVRKMRKRSNKTKNDNTHQNETERKKTFESEKANQQVKLQKNEEKSQKNSSIISKEGKVIIEKEEAKLLELNRKFNEEK